MQTAVLCYIQHLNKGIQVFLDYSFLSSLYKFYLSIKDLEISDKFNLLQNLHLCTHKILFAPQAPDLSEKVAKSFFYFFHCKHILLKLKIQKFVQKISSKNTTAGV